MYFATFNLYFQTMQTWVSCFKIRNRWLLGEIGYNWKDGPFWYYIDNIDNKRRWAPSREESFPGSNISMQGSEVKRVQSNQFKKVCQILNQLTQNFLTSQAQFSGAEIFLEIGRNFDF